MTKLGKISSIKKEISNSGLQTMEKSLLNRGLTRTPGTGVFKYPYREIDGRYRTGLDPDASYIERIADKEAKAVEKERVKTLRKKLQDRLGVDLGPTSEFWNAAKSTGEYDNTHVQAVKLIDGDNLFDLSIPMQELNFAWLRVHPTIASSLQAYQRGDYPSNTQFYVVDDEIENAVVYKKKQLINKAIIAFEAMSPTRRKKVARLMGLPVVDDTKEEVVYNTVDDALKQSEFTSGKYKGMTPLKVFNSIAELDEKILTVKDLITQAISHSVYRLKHGGKVYEGELEVAKDEESLVKYLMNEDNQEDLISLEEKLKVKKLAAV